MKSKFEWEQLKKNTFRARVPGGWVLKNVIGSRSPHGGVSDAVALVFIPDRYHEWKVEK
jgi:hypothetical protein